MYILRLKNDSDGDVNDDNDFDGDNDAHGLKWIQDWYGVFFSVTPRQFFSDNLRLCAFIHHGKNITIWISLLMSSWNHEAYSDILFEFWIWNNIVCHDITIYPPPQLISDSFKADTINKSYLNKSKNLNQVDVVFTNQRSSWKRSEE